MCAHLLLVMQPLPIFLFLSHTYTRRHSFPLLPVLTLWQGCLASLIWRRAYCKFPCGILDQNIARGKKAGPGGGGECMRPLHYTFTNDEHARVQMWLMRACECMCVLTLRLVEELLVRNGEWGQKMGVLPTVLAKEPAFTFCSLEAECETLMKSNLHLWMPMKRLALFTTIEKPWPHTAGSKTCPAQHRPAKSSAPLALLFGCIGQRLFHHCVVWPRTPAGSPFINPLWGFWKQSKGTPPHAQCTRTQTNT